MAADPDEDGRGVRRDSERRARVIAAVLIVPLAIALSLSVRALWLERAVAEATAVVARHGAARAVGEAWSADATGPIDLSGPARALIQDALARAQDAELGKSPAERSRLLDQAQGAIAAAATQRPHWGEARTVEAYIAALRAGPMAAATQAAYARSYADAPYLRDAAQWRIGFGMACWPSLSAATRARLIDEAVWYARLRPELRGQIFALSRGTGAYAPLLLRWRMVRAADDDLMPNPDPAD